MESHLVASKTTDADDREDERKSSDVGLHAMTVQEVVVYRVYKRRWLGVVGLVSFCFPRVIPTWHDNSYSS